MRRGSDRVERWLTAGVLLVFVVAVPLVAGGAARAMYRADVRDTRQDRGKLVRAEAVLLEDAARPYPGDDGVAVDVLVARARWSGPDGRTHEGTIQVLADDKAGDRLAIWTDGRGTPTVPDPQPDPHADAAVVGTAAGLLLASVLGLLTCAGHSLLNRHRLRSWQFEWLEVGPRWTRHR